MTVRDVVLRSIEAGDEERDLKWLEGHEDKEPRLFISDIGNCHRKAFYAAFQAQVGHPFCVPKTHPFDMWLLEKFKFGRDMEEVTYQELLSAGIPIRLNEEGEHNIRVGNSIWAGRLDFLVDPCSDFRDGAVIEHKTTASYNFRVGDNRRLPYLNHCYQVLSYQWFLTKEFPAILYYRSCDNKWAEFNVTQLGDCIIYEGQICGRPVEGVFAEDRFDVVMHEMARGWPDNLPAKYESPTELDFACTKKVRGVGRVPACEFFGNCWPDVEVPIVE